jgi:stage II sporulation protein M
MRFKYWVFIAVGSFVVGLGIGLIVNATMPPNIVGLFSEEQSALEELAVIFSPFKAATVAFIFFKNASVLLFSFIFSPALCLVPILALVLNGALVSFISVVMAQEASVSLVLAGVLPHGIFEIPAIIIGEAAALNFGAAVIISLFSPTRDSILMPRFKQSLKYLLLALILLIPAAIIETFVTPLFLQ